VSGRSRHCEQVCSTALIITQAQVPQDYLDITESMTNGGAACTNLGAVSPLASSDPQAILTLSPIQTAAAPHSLSVSANQADGNVVFTLMR